MTHRSELPLHRGAGSRFSRRRALGLMAAAGPAVAGVAGCNVVTSTSNPSASGVPEISFPDSGASLPTEDVTFRWMDAGGARTAFQKPIFAAYHKQHPNITINYDGVSWDRINQVVPLGIRNGTAPDAFQIPNNMPAQTAVSSGWVAALDDVIPNFEEWKKNFPAVTFIPGVHVFDGKTYTLPAFGSGKWVDGMIFYNAEYLDKAELDPTSQRFTWSEFRAACKKLTKQGDGKYYGLMFEGANAGRHTKTASALAGALNPGGINWKTGRYEYTQPQIQATIELFQQIKSDGSFFPGSLSLGDAEARARIPSGVAAMILTGPWDVTAWGESSPDFKYGIGMTPMPDDKEEHFLHYDPASGNQLWIYAKSKYLEVAGDLLYYFGTPEGQLQEVLLSKGVSRSTQPEVNEKAKTFDVMSPQTQTVNDLADTWNRIMPVPSIRNSDAAKVTMELKAVKPSFDDVCLGALTGQVKDLGKALRELEQASDDNLDQAIATATKRGAQVSRDDYVFPNWDPNKDYTSDDYEKL